MKVLFIALDTLRADHLSCYGYSKPTSPIIDSCAKRGVLFSNFIAPHIPTQPAYTTIYTGRSALSHRIVAHGHEELAWSLSDDMPVLPEILRENGYITAAVDNLYNHKKWFTRGYDYYINPHSWQLITGDEINAKAIPWIKQNYEENFFLFLHYWDPHTPYLPPEKYRTLHYKGDKNDPDNHSMDPVKRRLVYPFFKKWHYDLLGEFTDIEYIVAQYDGEITYADEKVGELLDTLDEVGIFDDTLIIITADHGESLTEHNIYFDHPGLHEANTNVPLILIYPKSFPQGKKIEAMAQHIDLAPTILEFLNIPIAKGMEGKSLLPLIRGEEESIYPEIHTSECTWLAGRGIRTEEWKFIKSIDHELYPNRPERELYNLKDDPEETHNLAEEEKELVDEFELKIYRYLDRRLGSRPDPIRMIASKGVPAKFWLERVLREMNTTWDEWVKKQKYV